MDLNLTQNFTIYYNPIPENINEISFYSKMCIVAYAFLFIIGTICNFGVFVTVGREVWKEQLSRSRIKVLIWHLATADLIVCLVVIPIEIFWRLTVQWYGGDLLCRVSQFFRAFGLYLSSMVIICISLDKFFAILFPLKVIGGMNKRINRMLWMSWICAFVFSVPQLVIFSAKSSVMYPSFKQCTNSGYFTSLNQEITYNLFSLFAMYFVPLFVIILTYAMVLYKVAMKARQHNIESVERRGSDVLRRNDNTSSFTRARNRTLLLSMVIVTAFVICWTPYVFMIMWYMVDYESADKLVDPRVREVLFVTAVSNSALFNPIIYGNYLQFWQRCCKCFSTEEFRDMSSVVQVSNTNNPVNLRSHGPFVITEIESTI